MSFLTAETRRHITAHHTLTSMCHPRRPIPTSSSQIHGPTLPSTLHLALPRHSHASPPQRQPSLHCAPVIPSYSWTHSYLAVHLLFYHIHFLGLPRTSRNPRIRHAIDDEWLAVAILLEATRTNPNAQIHVCDSGGEFLLIECDSHAG